MSTRFIFNMMLVSVAFVGTAMAGFTEGRLESAKRSAQKSGKSIAFVFYKACSDPSCPISSAWTAGVNSEVEEGLPRTDVVIVKIYEGDKNLDKLPACVPSQGQVPRVVITDAACTKVVDKYQGTLNREQKDAIEKKVEDARKK